MYRFLFDLPKICIILIFGMIKTLKLDKEAFMNKILLCLDMRKILESGSLKLLLNFYVECVT